MNVRLAVCFRGTSSYLQVQLVRLPLGRTDAQAHPRWACVAGLFVVVVCRCILMRGLAAQRTSTNDQRKFFAYFSTFFYLYMDTHEQYVTATYLAFG